MPHEIKGATVPYTQINPATLIRTAQCDGSRPDLASVLQEGGQSANMYIRSGAIWGISAKYPFTVVIASTGVKTRNAVGRLSTLSSNLPFTALCHALG
jgi:hypothetical protein